MTKILIADDHDILFEGLIKLSENYFGTCEIRTARSYAEATQILKTFAPDYLITDIAMEEKDSGLLLCQDVIQCFQQTRIVLFTQFDNPYNIYQAYEMGVYVFLDKANLRADFAKAMHASQHGEKFHTVRVKQMILNYFQKYNGALPKDKIPQLTKIQTEYLHLFVQGKTDEEVAEFLHVTTVASKRMRQNLYAQFRIDGKSKLKIAILISKARELGHIS